MLNKQAIDISFAQGLDTKTDPFRVQPGKFLSLQNSVFDKGGQLKKRNGFGALTPLPAQTPAYLTTFNGDLTALGTTLESYSTGSSSWVNKGSILPCDLTTLPAVRNGTYQGQADSVTATNGIACVAYTDYIPSGGSVTPAYKYVILDATTGQNIVAPTLLPNADPTYGTPRVFLMGPYFIILYTTPVGGVHHLSYIAISTQTPTYVSAVTDISNGYSPSTTVAFDGIVANSNLYIAYNNLSGGQSVKVTYLSQSLALGPTVTFSGQIGTIFSLAVDETNPTNPLIYVSYYNLGTTTGYTFAVYSTLAQALAPTATIASGTILNLTSVAQGGGANSVCTLFYEVANNYSYDSAIPTHYIDTNTLTITGTLGTPNVLKRSVGLASKAFLYNSEPYVLSIYESPYQPTYFLLNASGIIISKLAYSNGGNYYTLGLPSTSVNNDTNEITISYLYKDSITALNTQGNSIQSVSGGIYAQLGINLVTFNFAPPTLVTAEIGNNLNYTGGYLSMYDGVTPVEQSFFLWPDSVEAAWSATGGAMGPQPDNTTNTNAYYYQVTYEWTDNQGNLFRSAPSIPVGVTTTGTGETGTGSVILNIPTLRLTYKTNVSIVIYRWSAKFQNYYQTTSITAPVLNNTTVDSITYVDTLNDSSIQGNNLIYTTGGVLEDIAPPATDLITLFNNRVWLLDAEDRNLLWFSKQVIEATPVEFSDLLTLYVAPTTASEGSTGPITAMAPMDDKLIIFKQNALGYVNGIGPDNTGANSQYSDFTLINSVVGCTNQQSIVFMPQGLMFQSNKGIWLVGRDLATQYIGAPVESLTTGATVLSAVNVPATNQVRFTLDSGITLIYDYFYSQWGTFTNLYAQSSTIYQGLHTYVTSLGQLYQETNGVYLDGSTPVTMSFTTGWITLAGVQGYERFYQLYLLGQYLSPFNLNVQLAYNYNPSPTQSTIVSPSQQPVTWGSDQLWGSGSTWGSQGDGGWEGQANVFEARVFPQQQKCESFQVTVTEVYNSQYGNYPGAGLTLTGMNLIVGTKRGFRTSKASRNFG